MSAEMSEERIAEIRSYAERVIGDVAAIDRADVIALCDALLASRREREEARDENAKLVADVRDLRSGLEAAAKLPALRDACRPLVKHYDDIALNAGERKKDDLDWLQIDAALVRPICEWFRGKR